MDPIQLTGGMRSNLLSLQKTQSNMETTQSRLATGLRVQSALDDPINYFAAKGHKDRAGDLAFRKEEMNEGIQTLKAADNGISAVLNLIASAKSLAQSALSGDSTTAINTLETQYAAVMTQISDLSEDSGYKGVNLLSSDNLEVRFNETGSASVMLTGFDGSAGTGLSMDTTVATNSWTAGGAAITATIDEDIVLLDTARATLRSKSEEMSNSMSTISIRQDFTANMINTLKDGAAQLTEADLNEEGANMLMLQTRQALGTTSLSMASQAAQSVMRLF